MIGQNLGAIERVARLLLALGLGTWALMQPALGLVEGLVLLAAGLLVLNCVFGRCYLWALLNLNTCDRGDKSCGRRANG